MVGTLLLLTVAQAPGAKIEGIQDPSKMLAWTAEGKPVPYKPVAGAPKASRLIVVQLPAGADSKGWRAAGATVDPILKQGRAVLAVETQAKAIDLEGYVFSAPWKVVAGFSYKKGQVENVTGKDLFPGIMVLRPGEGYGPNGPTVKAKGAERVRVAVRVKIPAGGLDGPQTPKAGELTRTRAWDGRGKPVKILSRSSVFGKFEAYELDCGPREFGGFKLETRKGQRVRFLGVPLAPRAAKLSQS